MDLINSLLSEFPDVWPAEIKGLKDEAARKKAADALAEAERTLQRLTQQLEAASLSSDVSFASKEKANVSFSPNNGNTVVPWRKWARRDVSFNPNLTEEEIQSDDEVFNFADKLPLTGFSSISSDLRQQEEERVR